MKRSLSDSESDDGFEDRLKAGSPSQSCQITDRKKRRGIIEKRRRDRINNSLSELRRLVPSAFEKQGSAKLEKAEILQMTVDHLKLLHQKGINTYNFDPHAVAMDYRSVGFRECAAEVARYMVAVEGMDLQDPLRLRLLSHLQCYSAQREAAAKASLQNSSWSSMTPHSGFNSQYGSATMSGMSGMITSQHVGQSEHVSSMSAHSGHSGVSSSVSFSESRLSQSDSAASIHGHMRLPTAGVGGQVPSMNSSTSQVSQISPPLLSSLPQLHNQFPVSLNVNSVSSMMSPNSGPIYNPATSANQHSHSVKPYRPWGAELAY
ncbi:hairy/enhancer-of-split related with YRPW motif protein 1-like [Haliotis cracherodii]|uniref:hairy/enhancer-of-split related with YRPW motif protein 1-like n=1 Tax=Haliotis rufescens TaxID=6454 RepID=UPI00201FA83E|nr:hairy/enhancer-of-split related with YRPW motif protein 1-like [Haliotis rufescens]